MIVWRTRYVTFAWVLVLAALVLLARGAQDAKASPFSPTLSTTLSSNAAGAVANITTSYSWGLSPNPNRAFPAVFQTFTPGGWTIPSNAGCSLAVPGNCAYPMGNLTGTASSFTTLGLFGTTGTAACAVNVPVFFPGSPLSTGLLNASTDPGDFIAAGAGFAALIADGPPNGPGPTDGIMDGAEHWNDLLLALGLPAPRERQVATANLFGTTLWVDNVTYDPGVLAPAGLGYVTLIIVENFSPALPATPGLITDSCGLTTSVTQNGLAANGATHRQNPPAPGGPGTGPGSVIFFLNSQSQRDADNDGFPNALDTCAFSPNVGAFSPVPPGGGPLTPAQPANGDDAEPASGDGIDGACDPNPGLNDGGDIDGDSYTNRGDNCVLVPNGLPNVGPPTNQSDIFEVPSVGFPFDPSWWVRVGAQPVDGGPTNDGIGDACDINSTVADGHYHQVLNLSPKCINDGFFVDSDGDGWCDQTEFVLGSSPATPGSTPEALAVPTTCSDGADNDGDGSADLADSGCQLPNHDIAIKKLVGGQQACKPSNTVGYNVQLKNFTTPAVTESAEIGILLDAVPGTGGSGPAVVTVNGATPTASGPINVDGDTDVEWLTKALVSVASGSSTTTVHFNVTYPPCGAGPDVTPVDYLVTVDACHGDDIAPLGLFGLTSCGATGDGGQDRLTAGNDAPVTVLVNDVSK